MAGLSTTHYDSATISIAGGAAGDTATATSGGTLGGRALSDVAHSSGGLRYFEVEVVQLRSTSNAWGIGITDNTSDLTQWIGGGTHSGFWWRDLPAISRYASGARLSVHGDSAGAVGMRAIVWVDPVSRKMWITATDRLGYRYGDDAAGPPSGTPSWTVPGTGPLRVALTPARGNGSTDANVLRFCSRYSQLRVRGAELLGALPWDARQVTINLVMRESIGGAYIASGTAVSYAVFEGTTPGVLSTPTTVGTATVGASGALALPASISVDPGAALSVLVSTTGGTPGTQARSHYMPVVAP